MQVPDQDRGCPVKHWSICKTLQRQPHTAVTSSPEPPKHLRSWGVNCTETGRNCPSISMQYLHKHNTYNTSSIQHSQHAFSYCCTCVWPPASLTAAAALPPAAASTLLGLRTPPSSTSPKFAQEGLMKRLCWSSVSSRFCRQQQHVRTGCAQGVEDWCHDTCSKAIVMALCPLLMTALSRAVVLSKQYV